jgi:hypothetical protein
MKKECETRGCCNPNHYNIKKKNFSREFEIDKKFLFRFWKKVKILEDDLCWEWQASKDFKGYGHFSVNGRTIRSHRLSYMIKNGKDSIPEGMSICHFCDNRKCVNPNHLFLGTNYDNVQDRHTKGRDGAAIGEKHGKAKLKEEDVLFIRESYADKKFTRQELAEMFGIKDGEIGNIVKGLNWKNVGGRITLLDRPRDAIAKLNKEKVREIRLLLINSSLSKKEISIIYDVTEQNIKHISLNKTWKDVVI